jgi:hypothetical protein
MLKKLLFSIFLLSIVSQFSCNTIVSKDFEAFATNFIAAYRPLFPDEGPLSIDNESLGRLAIPTPTYFDSVREFHRNFTTELKQFDRSILPPSTLKNVQKVENILKSINSFLTDYQQNPQRFNILHGFKRIKNADFASEDYLAKTLLAKLDQVPLFYETAKQRLSNVNRTSADAAVEQHLATFLFLESELPQFFEKNGQLAPPQYQPQIEAAKLAVKDYVAFVESFRLN